MSDDSGISGHRSAFPKTLGGRLLSPARAKRRPPRLSPIHWWYVLRAVSTAGATATIVSAVIGRETLSLWCLAATVVVTGALIIHAVKSCR